VGCPHQPDLGKAAQPKIARTSPEVRTVWEFMSEYGGSDKAYRLQDSFRVGMIGRHCSGTMISPHIYMTAAHCGGTGWTNTVQFIRIDEDSPSPGAAAMPYSDPHRAKTFPPGQWLNLDDELVQVLEHCDPVHWRPPCR
jgi:hypothetical protein